MSAASTAAWSSRRSMFADRRSDRTLTAALAPVRRATSPYRLAELR